MPKLFGIDIAKIANDSIGGGLVKGKLIKITKTEAEGAKPLDPPIPSDVKHNFNGMVSSFKSGDIDGDKIRVEDRKVLIMAASLPFGVQPKKGDKVFIEDETYLILKILKRDPAAATYLVHGRV